MQNIQFDYSKLCGKIKELFGTQENFAKAIGVTGTTLSCKLNNKSTFTKSQINRSCDALNINIKDVPAYFFTPKVK